ncbi:MAG: hypothetical protein L7H10_07440 [Vulcanisaeta sp.]|jgi:hypothetical protein|nr:hypothetical protein [Vulcanisaeta sp.]MCG2870566.1 hypothetical protein [Vulcanisaeta sp.]MCG2887682.1 hypothetical protein [Vulcanisaeta sp.]
MDRDEVVKAIYNIINWLIDPAKDFDTVLNYLNELCNELGTCVKVDEPTRLAVMKAVVELLMEILSKCAG